MSPTPAPPAAPADAAFGRALDHTWAWFSLHSDQRMSLINHWMIGTAFVTAAYATSVSKGEGVLALVIGFVGAGLTFGFSRLDRRTRQLTRLAEDAMVALEAQMSTTIDVPALRLVERAEAEKGRFTSYGRVIAALHGSAVVLFVVAGITGPALAG